MKTWWKIFTSKKIELAPLEERVKSCDPFCRNNVSKAYNALVLALDNPKIKKAELISSMEEAVGYLGEVLE